MNFDDYDDLAAEFNVDYLPNSILFENSKGKQKKTVGYKTIIYQFKLNKIYFRKRPTARN